MLRSRPRSLSCASLGERGPLWLDLWSVRCCSKFRFWVGISSLRLLTFIYLPNSTHCEVKVTTAVYCLNISKITITTSPTHSWTHTTRSSFYFIAPQCGCNDRCFKVFRCELRKRIRVSPFSALSCTRDGSGCSYVHTAFTTLWLDTASLPSHPQSLGDLSN